MNITLCIPTRGVIFARTIESAILSKELQRDSAVVIVSGQPIPLSHNECISRALQTACTHLWFVEEDMEIPQGVLTQMIKKAEMGFEIVAVDYPMTDTVRTTIFEDNAKTLWSGFGCTLISRRIFEDVLHAPWLSSEHTVYIHKEHPFTYTVKEEPESKDKVYGRYDIWFGLQMKEKGIPIAVIPNVKCNHLRMKSWERKTVNNGAHDIYQI
jgi:hypothetical protein